MRRVIDFPCAGDTLLGSLDEAAGSVGLLIVSGGNELRSGAHRGMALLAGRVAARGVAVFRYDRRGVGDSEGSNRGFEGARDDLVAAAAAFRQAMPGMAGIVGFGNCDGATTLALWGAEAGLDRLVLANPWLIEGEGAAHAPAAIRARYRERMRDWRSWVRLLRGGVDLSKLVGGMRRAASAPPACPLQARVGAALARSEVPATLLLARRDNTAIACADAWNTPAFAAARERVAVAMRDTASHSFARPGDAEWLEAQILAAIDATAPR